MAGWRKPASMITTARMDKGFMAEERSTTFWASIIRLYSLDFRQDAFCQTTYPQNRLTRHVGRDFVPASVCTSIGLSAGGW